jgi:hypothetical protein
MANIGRRQRAQISSDRILGNRTFAGKSSIADLLFAQQTRRHLIAAGNRQFMSHVWPLRHDALAKPMLMEFQKVSRR